MIRGISGLPPRFLDGYDRATGTLPVSEMTYARQDATDNIVACASKWNTSVEEVVRELGANGMEDLSLYVQSKGESPMDTPDGLLVQAALLRANDIAVVASAQGISDDAALAQIEDEESIHVDQGTGDVDNILPASLQAAVKIVMDTFLQKMTAATGISNMAGAIGKIRTFLSTPLSAVPDGLEGNNVSIVKTNSFTRSLRKKNRAVGDDGSGDISDSDSSDDDLPIATSINYGSVVSQNTPAASTSVVAPTTISPTANASVVASSPVAGTSFTSILTNIATVAGSLGSSITSTANSLSNTASNVGASSIQKYIAANWLQILIFVIAAAFIIMLIAHASKRK